MLAWHQGSSDLSQTKDQGPRTKDQRPKTRPKDQRPECTPNRMKTHLFCFTACPLGHTHFSMYCFCFFLTLTGPPTVHGGGKEARCAPRRPTRGHVTGTLCVKQDELAGCCGATAASDLGTGSPARGSRRRVPSVSGRRPRWSRRWDCRLSSETLRRVSPPTQGHPREVVQPPCPTS